MIDIATQVERLLARLKAALPLPAIATPELLATLQAQDPTISLRPVCEITWISYGGDEAGIVCGLDFGCKTESATVVSITHLRFDPRQPLTREIPPTRSTGSSDCAASRNTKASTEPAV